GVAGFINAALAVHRRTLPPAAGCRAPHPEITRERPVLRLLQQAEPWPDRRVRRAGISAMGFGGINVHLAIEERRDEACSSDHATGRAEPGRDIPTLSALRFMAASPHD